jgi:D-alanyl-D-alanine carboxypeptidase
MKVEVAPLPPQPPGAGTGKGILGVLTVKPSSTAAMAYAEPLPNPHQQPPAAPPPAVAPAQTIEAAATSAPTPAQTTKPALKAGTWIVQVGALESEAEANKRLSEARASAMSALAKAEQFTEAIDKGDKRLYRARFANLDRDRAETACRLLKRSDISCIAIKN